MIYDELRNMVVLTLQDDTVQTFDDAVSLFEAMGQDDYMGIFEATIGSMPDNTEQEIIDSLLLDIDVITNNIFTTQGVNIKEDVLLSDKVKIARGLLDIFDYEDRSALARVLETDQNPEEIVAELLCIVTPFNSEQLFDMIQEVNPAVPQRIKDLIVEEAMELSYNEMMKDIVQLYIHFKERLLDNTPFYTDKYLESVETIGLDYATYLRELLKYPTFTELLSKLDSVGKVTDDQLYIDISNYLVAIACLCSDGYTNPIEIIRSNMDKVTNNVSAIGKLENQISKSLIKLTSSGATNE